MLYILCSRTCVVREFSKLPSYNDVAAVIHHLKQIPAVDLPISTAWVPSNSEGTVTPPFVRVVTWICAPLHVRCVCGGCDIYILRAPPRDPCIVSIISCVSFSFQVSHQRTRLTRSGENPRAPREKNNTRAGRASSVPLKTHIKSPGREVRNLYDGCSSSDESTSNSQSSHSGSSLCK